jgi:PAS domain S-box-containing protein
MADVESDRPRDRDVLAGVLAVQVVFALTAGAVLILDPTGIFDDNPLVQLLSGSLVLMPIVAAAVLGLRFRRSNRSERIRIRAAARLMDTVLSTSREWVWAVDDRGLISYSSAACSVLGYAPSELVGQPVSLVLDGEDLTRAQAAIQALPESNGATWSGSILRCRHRDGTAVWMELAGAVRPAADGMRGGFEGTSRLLPPKTAQEVAESYVRDRIRAIIDGKLLVTAFQPIRNMVNGHLVGVEALSRFVSDDGLGPEYWFKEAAAVGLAADLELAAMEAAIQAAQALPPGIYVALNISPATCLDPRLPEILESSDLCLSRFVLELTEQLEVSEYGPLLSALAPLRQGGLRIAVDDAGSGFASMRHVLHLRPDIIKLDRSLIAGIDDDLGQHALGGAMVEFARRIGASLVAEGIETQAELAAVASIGMTAGQGYLLGRPSVHPREWAAWHDSPTSQALKIYPDGHNGPGT